MKFCEKCGNVLIIATEEYEKFLFCKKCNVKYPLNEDVVFSTSFDEKKDIFVIESDESEFPTTTILCPQCQTMEEAEWAMQQTRAGDEPPTRFYRCKKCKWVWRDYS